MDYYENEDVNNRINQILYERAALGGCNGCPMCGGSDDYSEMFGGAAKKKAKKKVNKTTNAAKSQKMKLLAKIRKQVKKEHPKWDNSKVLTASWKILKQAPQYKKLTSAKPQKKSGSKTVKKKTVVDKKKVEYANENIYFTVPKNKVGKYGYPKVGPTKAALANLGLPFTKAGRGKFFEEIMNNNDKKLTKNQLQRIGYHYQTKNKKGACVKPMRDGDYLLDVDYECRGFQGPKQLKKKRLAT
jgi:hypothetical protein